jgi:hypothetical protein
MRFSIAAVLIWLGIVVLGAIGWVLNIITIFNTDHILDSCKGILRVVGIFVPPLGAIMGWL